MSKFARKSDGRHATVCKDIPPKSARKVKKEPVPTGKTTHSVSLPIEYEMVLQEMYPDVSVAIAIRKFVCTRIKIEKNGVCMKMTRTAVMARQLRLAFVRQFFDNGTLSKEEAEELLSAPLDPNNKETFVDDKEFLQDPDALEKIAAQLED